MSYRPIFRSLESKSRFKCRGLQFGQLFAPYQRLLATTESETVSFPDTYLASWASTPNRVPVNLNELRIDLRRLISLTGMPWWVSLSLHPQQVPLQLTDFGHVLTWFQGNRDIFTKKSSIFGILPIFGIALRAAQRELRDVTRMGWAWDMIKK